MQTLTEIIIDAGYRDRILTDGQLARLVGGSAQRRYGLVNRALQQRELLQIQRGLYVLTRKFRTTAAHPFHVAQALVPGSHVSLETALAWHGWIPEAVLETASVIRGGRFRELDHSVLGRFTFTPLATHTLHQLSGVEQHRLEQQSVLVASPVRALLDLVCNRKLSWQGQQWLTDSLRIDPSHLDSIHPDTLAALLPVYKHKRMHTFIKALMDGETS